MQLEHQPKRTLEQVVDDLDTLWNTRDMAETPEHQAELDQQIQQTVAALVRKTDAVAEFIRSCERKAEQCKDLAHRAQDRAAQFMSRERRMREIVRDVMVSGGHKRLDGLANVISLKDGAETLEITGDIAAEFCTIIPPQLKPDKARIKAALKQGAEITGAALKPGTPHIQIR